VRIVASQALTRAGHEVLEACDGKDDTVGVHYGEIRSALERSGTPIGNNELRIAAHARAAGCALVTNNEREFGRVESRARGSGRRGRDPRR
jgi:predicted nucleic acid-binding protein